MKNIKEKSQEQLSSEYGYEVANEIAEHINYCSKENLEYELYLTQDLGLFCRICFSTSSFSFIYEISKERKCIREKTFVGFNDCMEALELMKMAEEKQKEKAASSAKLTAQN